MFGVSKLTNGRTPDQVHDYDMPAAEVEAGKVVRYDAANNDLTVASTSGTLGVLGICVSEPNQSMDDGGGITFPLGGTVLKPVVMRIYRDTLVEADVTGVVHIADLEPGDDLDVDANGTGLVAGVNGDFIVEKILADDGTDVKKVRGYFVRYQLAG